MISVNDNDHDEKDYLCMVFDRNQNGMIDLGRTDKPYGLWANGMTAPSALMQDGSLGFAEVPAEQGEHKCTFDLEEGYTFELPLVRWRSPMPESTIVQLSFVDHDVTYGKTRVVKADTLQLKLRGDGNESR